jgi:hypothetical protein
MVITTSFSCLIYACSSKWIGGATQFIICVSGSLKSTTSFTVPWEKHYRVTAVKVPVLCNLIFLVVFTDMQEKQGLLGYCRVKKQKQADNTSELAISWVFVLFYHWTNQVCKYQSECFIKYSIILQMRWYYNKLAFRFVLSLHLISRICDCYFIVII